MTTMTVRIGDIDRERTSARLGIALSQGYLTFPEFESRVQRAFAASTAAELEALIGDLPAQVRRHDPQRQAARIKVAKRSIRFHTAAYLAMVVIVLTVWTLTAIFAGATYFWPVWPILGAGIGLAFHVIPLRMVIRNAMS